MPAPRKYPDELRERAIRLTVEARKDPADRAGACKRIGEQLWINAETLRGWVTQSEVDQGTRPGTTSSDTARLLQLETAGLPDSAPDVVEDMNLAHFPRITELASMYTTAPIYPLVAFFDVGLNLVLDGIERFTELFPEREGLDGRDRSNSPPRRPAQSPAEAESDNTSAPKRGR
jgi:transposase